MHSIVRKADGKNRIEFLRAGQTEGPENPTDEDLRRLNRGRKDKRVSNYEWENRTTPTCTLPG